jgi:ATP-binding cassette subfamily B protein
LAPRATSSSTCETTFFARLQQFEPAYYHRNRTGDLMSRATNDLNAVRMMIGPAVMYMANTVLTFVAVIVLMLSINRRLTLLSLIPLPFLSVAVYFFGAAIHRRFDRIQEQLSTISAITQEALSGVRVVRAYGQEPFEVERFRLANEEYVGPEPALIRIPGRVLSDHGAADGRRRRHRAVARQPRRDSGTNDDRRARRVQLIPDDAGVPMNRVRLGHEPPAARRRIVEAHADVLDAEPAITDVEASSAIAAAGQIHGDVEFRNLTFSYGDRVVLRDVSAVLPAGTTDCHRRRNRVWQVDAVESAAAPPGSAGRDGVRRRHRRAPAAARGAPRRHRLRPAGAVSLQRDDC